MKFRLLVGQHIDTIDGKDVLFKPGDVIDSPTDLVAKLNSTISSKFEKVLDEVPSSPGVPAPGIPPAVKAARVAAEAKTKAETELLLRAALAAVAPAPAQAGQEPARAGAAQQAKR